MDTMELINQETVETATDALTSAGAAIANAASTAIQNAPEIRYVEVPVEGPASIGAVIIGAAAGAIVTIAGVVGYKWNKKRKAKKAAEQAPTINASGTLEGYERKTEQAEAQQTNDQKPEEAEPVKGEVVDKKPEKK